VGNNAIYLAIRSCYGFRRSSHLDLVRAQHLRAQSTTVGKHVMSCKHSAARELADRPQILKAFQEDHNGGKVVLSRGPNYWIIAREVEPSGTTLLTIP
jgi:hypothetical protein